MKKITKEKADKYAKEILKSVGLMYDDSELISGRDIEKKLGAPMHLNASPKGERIWKARGSKKTALIFDCGNDWWQIIKIFSKEERIEDGI